MINEARVYDQRPTNPSRIMMEAVSPFGVCVCVCVCETPVPKGSFGSFDLWSRVPPCGLLIQKYLEIGDGTPDEDASHERNCLRISMPKLECKCFVLVLVLPQNQVCVGTASGLRSVS